MSPAARAKKNAEQLHRYHGRKALGLCSRCNERIADTSSSFCDYHQMLNRNECRDANRNAYRLKKGIALDAPLSRRGRPRIDAPLP